MGLFGAVAPTAEIRFSEEPWAGEGVGSKKPAVYKLLRERRYVPPYRKLENVCARANLILFVYKVRKNKDAYLTNVFQKSEVWSGWCKSV